MPQRQELKAPESVNDLADILNYYEHLVQEWEVWGDTVETIVTEKNNIGGCYENYRSKSNPGFSQLCRN